MEQQPKPATPSPKPAKPVNTVRGQESLRERIISAAEELFLLGGVQGVSMRKIADKVGVTAPAIYRHFKDKDELLGELINVGLKILQDYLEPALQAEGPFERLEQLIDRYFDFALEQPKYFDLAFLVPSHGMRMADELARHIARLVRGEADWSSLRASALARHADRFSDSAMAAGVARVYDEVLGAVGR